MSSIRPGVNDEAAVRAVCRSPVHSFCCRTGGVIETTEGSARSLPQTVIWGTDVNIARVMAQFKHFLLTFTLNDCSRLPARQSGEPIDPQRPLYVQRMEDMALSGATALDVDCEHIRQTRPDLCAQLVTFPKEVIPACDAAANALFLDRFRDVQLERSIQIRPFNCGRSRTLRSLDPDDLDQLVTVTGLVIRLSSLIPEMMRAEFKCAVCGALTSVACERGCVAEPEACVRCHSAHTAQLLHNRCLFVDKQMIKLQESPEDMPASQTPHTVALYVHEELVDKMKPGDRVKITGIYRGIPLRVSNRQRTLKAVYKTYIDVLHFSFEGDGLRGDNASDEDRTLSELDICKHFTDDRIREFQALARKPDLYERLSAGIAPTIYENEDVKKGILLQMTDSTRSVLHEVMEQQTLSIAKAGILCQLHARTSILAAANPVGSKWDPHKTIIDNIQLPHTLLSRFDLIFLILDPQDEIYDARLARHLVSLYYYRGSGFTDADRAGGNVSGAQLVDVMHVDGDEESSMTAEFLKDYIAYAKAVFHPKLSEEAGEYLVREYVEMRKLGAGRGQITAYPRQLESLVRLAEAHARLRLSKIVTADDCREARRLQREALKQAAIDPVTGTIDINILTTGR
ncbi:DNA helicase [Fasciola gigantica]|uniref:DNA replication licensing factor MCM4 n=1 Tax=Fasciola gigantica TaxID=46835 RepID=A0A504YGD1_FASGI|nr:DNA helicase [Fasciola gigantica]